MSSTPIRPVSADSMPSSSRGGNNANDRRNRHFRGGNLPNTSQTRFEGRCNDLKGFIYDCADVRQADQYARTTKEIGEYIGRTFKFGMDARLSIENMEAVTIEVPSDPPTEASRTEIRIWEKKVDDYVNRETILKENLKNE